MKKKTTFVMKILRPFSYLGWLCRRHTGGIFFKKRVAFYFDGFNFYYGLRSAVYKNSSWQKYYWLDFVKLANEFIEPAKGRLQFVKYFTAQPLEPGKQARQASLFNANKLLNPEKFIIVSGKYYKKKIKCQKTCKQYFNIHEEKRTDVNISVEIIRDCIEHRVDTIYLVSADSDMIPTIEFVKSKFPWIELKVCFPPERKSTEIMNLMKRVIFLNNNKGKFNKAIMPTTVTVESKSVTIPMKWV